MQETPAILIALGGILILGLVTDYLGRRTFLPRVTLLILLGILIGEEALDIIPVVILDRFDLISDMTLIMIGFLLGGKLTYDKLHSRGNQLLWISVCAALGASIVVFLGLLAIGIPLVIAVIVGCIASATDPAATTDVIDESGAEGPFPDLLLAVVAIDDAWGLIIFSLGFAIILSISGLGGITATLLHAIHDIGGAVLLGALIGFPAAYLTGRIRAGRPMLTEALGLVFLCGGIAIWLEVSFLIASMVMGTIIGNFARHHDIAFHEIENIEWPFLIIFFVLAGALLDISSLKTIGIIGIAFILCRSFGKFIGAWIGGTLSKANNTTRNWMGLALLPQAGVAIGMALVASIQFPEYRQMLLSIIISTTVCFELIGPVFIRIALQKAGTTG
jgi:Kef-type K+ transport system membrane component KefB